jgi:hypothetical protein
MPTPPDIDTPTEGEPDQPKSLRDQHPKMLMIIRSQAALAVVFSLVLVGLAVRAEEWRDAAGLMVFAALVTGGAIVSWRIDSIRDLTRFAQIFFGVIAVGSTAAMIVSLIAGQWSMAAYIGLSAIYICAMIPRRDESRRSDFGAIQTKQGMDERRKQISLKADAAAYNLVVVVAGAVALGSFIASAATENGPGVWLPALAVYATVILLPMPLAWFYAKRM